MEEDKEKNEPSWKGIHIKTLYSIAVVIGILIIVNLLFYTCEKVKQQRKEARLIETLELRKKEFKRMIEEDTTSLRSRYKKKRKHRKVFGDGVDTSLFNVK